MQAASALAHREAYLPLPEGQILLLSPLARISPFRLLCLAQEEQHETALLLLALFVFSLPLLLTLQNAEPEPTDRRK